MDDKVADEALDLIEFGSDDPADFGRFSATIALLRTYFQRLRGSARYWRASYLDCDERLGRAMDEREWLAKEVARLRLHPCSIATFRDKYPSLVLDVLQEAREAASSQQSGDS